MNSWVNKDAPSSRAEELPSLIQNIRFLLMDPKEFSDIVMASGVLEHNEALAVSKFFTGGYEGRKTTNNFLNSPQLAGHLSPLCLLIVLFRSYRTRASQLEIALFKRWPTPRGSKKILDAVVPPPRMLAVDVWGWDNRVPQCYETIKAQRAYLEMR
jgi:hypothetical protein